MLDIMTLAEWKASTASLVQWRYLHANLQAIDNALSAYELVPKQNIENRIRALNRIMNVTEGYAGGEGADFLGGISWWFQTAPHIQNKLAQAGILFKQAEAKREYLAGILGIEYNLGAFFGQGGLVRTDPPLNQLHAIVRSAANLQKYIGSVDAGRRLDMHYWTEAIDPLHRHWGNPRNSPVFAAWMARRWDNQSSTTTLSFFRWMETLTDQESHALLQTGEKLPLLSTNYQDAVGREEFRIRVNGNHLKYLASPNSNNLEMWGTEKYSTNFGGQGWCIFVMSPEGELYASSHDQDRGWFHSAFMGGKPVRAAGELWARNGKLYVMTDKSGHYKPGIQHLVDAARELNNQGLDISSLQIWARHTLGGMAPRPFHDGIWYMSVDAEQYLRTDDLGRSMLYDFGYSAKFGGIRGTYRGGFAKANQVWIQANEADLANKNKFQGGTCGARQ
jgi:hypothetical protein